MSRAARRRIESGGGRDSGEHGRRELLRVRGRGRARAEPAPVAGGQRGHVGGRPRGTGSRGAAGRGARVRVPDGGPGTTGGGRRGAGARGRHSQPPRLRGRVGPADRRRAVQRAPVVGQPDRGHDRRARARRPRAPVPETLRPTVRPVLLRVQDQVAHRLRPVREQGLQQRPLLLRYRGHVAAVEPDRRRVR